MEQFFKDLQSICRQYGHKVDIIQPTINAEGKILDVSILMEDDSEDNPFFNIPINNNLPGIIGNPYNSDVQEN